MNSNINKRGEEVRAPDTPSHTPPGAERWKEVLQLLKEQNRKMERLRRALSVIQQGMLRNNPGVVKDLVNEATDTPKKLTKGEKRVAPSPPEDRLPKKGKGGI